MTTPELRQLASLLTFDTYRQSPAISDLNRAAALLSEMADGKWVRRDESQTAVTEAGLIMAEALAENTKLQSQLHQRDEVIKECVDRIQSSTELLHEVVAYGNCDCDIPNGETCIPCQCAYQENANRETLAHAQQLKTI